LTANKPLGEIPPTGPVRTGETVASGQPPKIPAAPGETVGLMVKKHNMDPVVGWLVCIEGGEQGRDYRIRSEKNSIGRSELMDIAIGGDDTISRDNHAYLVFNPKNGIYRLQAGESRGLVYVNGEEVINYVELKAYDVIEIGETKLSFVPFCGEQFQW
jgi:hypothetical protein